LKKHGEAGQFTLVYVLSVSDAGVARFVKPNPWATGRPSDKRAGWTKHMTCRAAELYTELTPAHGGVIQAIVKAIGMPGGGE